MTVTRKTVTKGMGGLGLREIATNRLIFLTLNSSMEFTKTVDEGDAPTGVGSSGTEVDLDTPAKSESFELVVNTKKMTRGVNELMFGTAYASKTGYEVPWFEEHDISGAAVTLYGTDAPVDGETYVTFKDGAKLTEVGATPSAGEFVDNGDGTLTFNAADNGKSVIVRYKFEANINVQGGADYSELTYFDAMFYQITGTSGTANNVGVDILWLPKCGLSGDTSILFSNEVEDKTITLKPVIPDTPSGWSVPYQFIRDLEIDNRNAG